MSRSFKKAPVYAVTGEPSEKADKQRAHQAQRAHFRNALAAGEGEAENYVESVSAHSDRRGFAKQARKFVPNLRVQAVGRALRVLSAPFWARGDRAVHQALAK